MCMFGLHVLEHGRIMSEDYIYMINAEKPALFSRVMCTLL